MTNTERVTKIKAILNEVFSPSELEIIDNSPAHAGHTGHRGGGHFHVRIKSEEFEEKTRVQIHQMIYKALDDLLKTNEIHALSISV